MILGVLLQILLIGDGAQDQAETIQHELVKTLRELEVPPVEWAPIISAIEVERKLIRDECSEGRHPRGCTMSYETKDGEKRAYVWYLPGGDYRKVLRHEFKHAVLFLTGQDPRFH